MTDPSPDYAAFSRLSADAREKGVWTYYRWTGEAWAIAFTAGWGGLFGSAWEYRTGLELGPLAAAVRREIGL